MHHCVTYSLAHYRYHDDTNIVVFIIVIIAQGAKLAELGLKLLLAKFQSGLFCHTDYFQTCQTLPL